MVSFGGDLIVFGASSQCGCGEIGVVSWGNGSKRRCFEYYG